MDNRAMSPPADLQRVMSQDSMGTRVPAHSARNPAGFMAGAANWVQELRVVRAFMRFFLARGMVLSGGIAYVSLFSLTALLTVGWSIFSYTLRDAAFQTAVINAANSALPGLFKTSTDSAGLVDPSVLEATEVTSVVGAVALVVGLYSATSVVNYLTLAIRSMFGLGQINLPVVQSFLRRFLGLAVLLTSLLMTAALTSLHTVLHRTISEWLHFDQQQTLSIAFSVGTSLVSLVVDFLMFIVLVRWVAMVRPLRRDLLWGAAIAAAGSEILRRLGTSAVAHVSGPLLTAAAAVITLAIWINLLAMIMLLASAFAANPPLEDPDQVHAYQHAKNVPNFVTLSAPETLGWKDIGIKVSEDSEPSAAHDPKTADRTREP